MTSPEPVTDELRSDILNGELPPGERLVELDLTRRYRCGRAAIRSALVELATEGLVNRQANRGATVRRISLQEAIQITEARAALESLIAAQAARLATEGERQEIVSIVEQMQHAVDAADNSAYSELNRRFHQRLREVSRHQVAAELVANLRNRAAHHQYRLSLMPGRSATSLGQHGEIAAAVADGDEKRAAQAMDAHLSSVIDVLRQWGDAGPG